MFISNLEPFTQTSIDFLTQICESDEPFLHLTFDSFVALDQSLPPDRLSQNFNNATKISTAELKAQICFDLCRFYLHEKKYELAKINALESRDNLALTRQEYAATAMPDREEDEFLFCTFTEGELNGCLMACGVADQVSTGLLLRMNESIIEQYKVKRVPFFYTTGLAIVYIHIVEHAIFYFGYSRRRYSAINFGLFFLMFWILISY